MIGILEDIREKWSDCGPASVTDSIHILGKSVAVRKNVLSEMKVKNQEQVIKPATVALTFGILSLAAGILALSNSITLHTEEN